MSETWREEFYKSFATEEVTEMIKQSRNASCTNSSVEDKTVLVGAAKMATLAQLRGVLKNERALNKTE